MCTEDSGNVIISSAVTAHRMTDLNLKHSKCALGSICNTENGSLYSYKSKVKLSLCLTNQALCHEGVWGNGCIDPHFLEFGTSWG
jgi:hypothetical protein